MGTIKSKTLAYLYASLILISACSPTSTNQAPRQGVSSKQNDQLANKKQGDASKENESFDDSTAVFNYRNEQLIAKTPPQDKIDPSDAGKVFQVSRVPYYRILWMNLSQKNWQDTVHNWISNNITNPLYDSGVAAKYPGTALGQVDQVSIFQPLPRLRQDALENGGFRIVGYTANNKLDLPTYPTAVLATMAGQRNDVWAEPDDYELIYSQGVPGYPEIYEECLTNAAQIKMSMDTTLQEKCTNYLPEIFGNYSNIQQSSYSIDGSGNPTRWKNWFDVITVAIWRPIPRQGFGCLSYAASNGEADKPKVELADPNYEVTYQSEQASLYCIQTQYLSPGKLGEKLAKTSDGKVEFYRVKAVDPNEGYDDANFFYAKAIPEIATQKNEKIWVLKKSYLKILPDDTKTGN